MHRFDNYGNLQIANTSHDTSGNYICTAENDAGLSQKNFQVILNGTSFDFFFLLETFTISL